MNDLTRESLSYFGLYAKMFRAKKRLVPEYLSFGQDKDQYILDYEPDEAAGAGTTINGKTVLWVHGGGWNAGSPKFFDFVGQRIAGAGYPFISLGYRLSPKNKYPVQIEDVCEGYKRQRKCQPPDRRLRLFCRCPPVFHTVLRPERSGNVRS